MRYLVAVLAILGVIGLMALGSYNGMVGKQERVTREFAVIQAQLQRRADLIPNLVEVVKGYAEHESGVFREVTEARSRASQLLKIDPAEVAGNPELQKQLLEAQQTMGGALSRLMVVVEAYPDLKASEQYLTLQAQVEGTENRIATARRDAQLAVEQYNRSIRVFPNVVLAGMFGFEKYDYYQATAPNAEEAPKIKLTK